MEPIKISELPTLIKKSGSNTLCPPPRGYTWHDTPSHAYLMTDPHITKAIPEFMRKTTFSPIGKYEEDVDWCLPVIAHLEKFTEKIQIIALETFYNWHPIWFIQLYERIPVDSYKHRQTG